MLRRAFSSVQKGQVSGPRLIPPHILRPPYADTGIAPQMQDHVPILSEQEQSDMRQACRLAAKVLEYGGSCVKPGITTDAIDKEIHEKTIEMNAYPSPFNYCGFPKSVCTSINEVIVHGIPDDRVLEDGDIINLDVSAYLHGFHGDNSKTYKVGNVDDAGVALMETTELAMMEAIKICGPDVPFSEIGRVIHDIADKNGYSTVREFTGHGVGRNFHLLPFILHYRNNQPGRMQPGMAFTIEPMFCEGSYESVRWDDDWTFATKDGKRSAQYEHTILINEDGAEILTIPE